MAGGGGQETGGVRELGTFPDGTPDVRHLAARGEKRAGQVISPCEQGGQVMGTSKLTGTGGLGGGGGALHVYTMWSRYQSRANQAWWEICTLNNWPNIDDTRTVNVWQVLNFARSSTKHDCFCESLISLYKGNTEECRCNTRGFMGRYINRCKF